MDTKLIVSASPHVRSDETTQSLMANVIVALCPCVVASAIIFGVRVFGELPFDRIGAIFGHNAAWARVTYYRAKTRLQTMLEQRK